MDEDTAREIAELKARCDRLEAALAEATEARARRDPEILAMVKEALAQAIGLQIVSGVLLAEIGLLHKDPARKVSMTGAQLLGVLEATGHLTRREAATAAHLTKAIEQIVTIAESVLPGSLRQP